jgi:hypothetical protein
VTPYLEEVMVRKLIGLLVAVLACVGLTSGAAAAEAAEQPPLGGAVLHYLPPGLGRSTDFEYEFARVEFASRVWESGSNGTGWRVDLEVVVMHGARLSTARRLHDWFIRYEQRPPAEARYHPVRIHGRHGWACHDQVFWLARPGAAVSVRIDRSRWSRRALFRTARSIQVPWFPRFRLMTETGTRSNLPT